MPVGRLCRGCGKFCTEGYFHAECRRAFEREKSRRRRAKKGTTSQRGYDTRHQKLRALAIAQHPYCVDCGAQGTKENPLTADHVVPLSQGGLTALGNLEVRCRSCNSLKGSKVQ